MKKIPDNLFSCWISNVVQLALGKHGVENKLVLFFNFPLLSVY